jgi:mannose-1-phosphate guanylyltransferase
MLTFKTDTPSSCGIVEIDDQHIVQAFHEKLSNHLGNRANGAIYAFEQPLLDNLNRMAPLPSDFSTEVIPRLLGRIQTWHTDQAYLDIGTPEALTAAQQLLNQWK